MVRFLAAGGLIAVVVVSAAGADVRAREAEERILFVRRAANTGLHEEIRTIAPDGSSEERIDVGVDPLYMAEVSGDGASVVFGGAGNLHTAAIDGSKVARLPFTIQEHSATWSPDKSKLVFTDLGPEGWTFDLYIANLDGSDRRLLVNATGLADFPDWSPDGTKIAFLMNVSPPEEIPIRAEMEIFTINVDGTGLTQLTATGFNSAPDWSPDGSRIAFSSTRDGYSAIYTMNADGSDQRPVIAEHRCKAPCPGDDFPDWSPDGTRVVFQTQGGQSEIWSTNVDGTGLRQLTSGSGADLYPQWFAIPTSTSIGPPATSGTAEEAAVSPAPSETPTCAPTPSAASPATAFTTPSAASTDKATLTPRLDRPTTSPDDGWLGFAPLECSEEADDGVPVSAEVQLAMFAAVGLVAGGSLVALSLALRRRWRS